MTIFKNKNHPGIFKKYQYFGFARWTMFENMFTGEKIGNPPKLSRKSVNYLLTISGKWKESDFYPVAQK
jgi:hypothetical protein